MFGRSKTYFSVESCYPINDNKSPGVANYDLYDMDEDFYEEQNRNQGHGRKWYEVGWADTEYFGGEIHVQMTGSGSHVLVNQDLYAIPMRKREHEREEEAHEEEEGGGGQTGSPQLAERGRKPPAGDVRLVHVPHL